MKRKKISWKTSDRLTYILGSVGLAIALIGELSDTEWLGYAGWVVTMVAIVQSFIFCRCPKCNGILGNKHGIVGERCSHCGTKLEK